MGILTVLFLLLVRPVSSYVSLWRCAIEKRQKFVISFFGIRGMGSLFYLSFAIAQQASNTRMNFGP
ncbi:hypothetical protein GR160_00020 [Flavobacterium sp. Sd200]|uniref:hypothetical protein n=1 Tax=Flavobacterium sp. Sd200 TaxID=2692211 RepID=UPI0013715E5A|nr:hypothetical protein [Flavobacterium sp. Sd200]